MNGDALSIEQITRVEALQTMLDREQHVPTALVLANIAAKWILTGELPRLAGDGEPHLAESVAAPSAGCGEDRPDETRVAPAADSCERVGETLPQPAQEGGDGTAESAPQKSAARKAPANPTGIPHAQHVEAGRERRQKLRTMWLEGVPSAKIAKDLGYASAASVEATAVIHMGLPRRPRTKAGDAEMVAQRIAEKGVLTAPDFGDAEVNAVYQQLRARGHILNRATTGRYILNGSPGLSKADMLSRAHKIIVEEKPLSEIVKTKDAAE